MINRKIIVPTGLALFAMFFGAGNIIYPLDLGAHADSQLSMVILGFLITGVGVPFVGLYAVSLYRGDYWAFFQRLGKVPAFLIITFLIIIIGPLSATPRTEVVTFETIRDFLPNGLKQPMWFSLLYCSIVFILSYRPTKVVDIIGQVLSPIKLTAFLILIVLGLYSFQALPVAHESALLTFKKAVATGYSTMDLLATFFFCALAYSHIAQKASHVGDYTHDQLCKMVLKSCYLGAFLLSVVYIGFLCVAAGHQTLLVGVPTEAMISKTAIAIMGNFGELFVGVCVSFACLATAIALSEVSSRYLFEQLFQEKVPRLVCLIIVVAITYAMTLLGLTGIMDIASPILDYLYPALIVLCVFNILHLTHKVKMVQLPFYATLVAVGIYRVFLA